MGDQIFPHERRQLLEPNQRCHAASRLVASIGKKTALIGHGTETAAVHAGYTGACEYRFGQTINIGPIFSRLSRIGLEGRCEAGITLCEGIEYILPDLETVWSDCRPEPSKYLAGASITHARGRVLQYAMRKAAPAGMRSSDHPPLRIAKQYRKAIRSLDATDHAGSISDAGVRVRDALPNVAGIDHPCAMNLR